ncbi:phosphopantetheine-binding protein [Streptomyces sp. YGL11-2]|uniref:phosphopantetheine-binding protein n=1 Tax=Streptomyces sp. YGL11-2 TaxID=3414028 RepID=UPI003CEC3F9E
MNGSAHTEPGSDAPATGEQLRAKLADLIGVSPTEIADDANLIRLGLGSLQMMRLVTAWRRSGLPVTFGEMARTPTFSSWNELITRQVAAKAENSP